MPRTSWIWGLLYHSFAIKIFQSWLQHLQTYGKCLGCSGDYSLVESFPGVSNLGWNCSGINIYVTSACKILTQRVVATRLDQCRRAIFTALNICTTLDQTLRIMTRVVVSNVSPIVHEWWSWFINIKTKAKEKTYLARDASLSD